MYIIISYAEKNNCYTIAVFMLAMDKTFFQLRLFVDLSINFHYFAQKLQDHSKQK